MQEKAPKEFNRIKRHKALVMTSLVILPPEGHLAIGTGKEPPIGNGHAMRVAGQVAEDSLRPGQWRPYTPAMAAGLTDHVWSCDFNHKVAQTAMIWLNAFTAMIWLKTCKRVASSISMG